jgi:uncharacterized protein (TIGR02266 family)
MPKETRKDKRAPISLKVRFKSATLDEFIEQYSGDISQGGIFIKSKNPMEVGTLLKFSFQLKDTSPLITGVGRVVWNRKYDPNLPELPPGMGIKFIKMDPESKSTLNQILSSKEEIVKLISRGEERVKEAVSKPEEAVPKPKEVIPKPKEVAPKPKEVAPKPKEVAPKPEEVAPKPKEVAPKPEEVAPKPEEPAAKPEEPATKPEEPAPKPSPPEPQRRFPIGIFVIIVIIALGIYFLLKEPGTQKQIKELETQKPLPPKSQVEEIITLSSEPQGATVIINGKTHPQKTPLKLKEIKQGSMLQIKMKLQGFKEWTRKIKIEKPNQKINAKLEPIPREIRVESQPKGAEVLVNGKSICKSPCTIPNEEIVMIVEPMKLELKRPGYEEWKKEITPSDNWEEREEKLVLTIEARLKRILEEEEEEKPKKKKEPPPALPEAPEKKPEDTAKTKPEDTAKTEKSPKTEDKAKESPKPPKAPSSEEEK